jgi:hypothetical protein
MGIVQESFNIESCLASSKCLNQNQENILNGITINPSLLEGNRITFLKLPIAALVNIETALVEELKKPGVETPG